MAGTVRRNADRGAWFAAAPMPPVSRSRRTSRRRRGPVAVAVVVALLAGAAAALAAAGRDAGRPHRAVVAPAREAVRAARADAPAPAPAPEPAPAPSLARAVGRKIMTGFAGTTPSRALLARARRGQIGGVILFGPNVSAHLGATIRALQRAARAGGNPPLLVAVDQEGGEVRRLPSLPPAEPPARMPASRAGPLGTATGRALRHLGITVDLAPVADVDHGSFLGSRSFGSVPDAVAREACAFADGLQGAGVAATLKHFPGLGRATRNTDEQAVTITASASELRADLEPYRRCAPRVGLVMLANATYAALDARRPAVFSRRIGVDLLRGELGFRGVTITDTLAAPGVSSTTTAVRATRAGVDMLLYPDADVSALAYRNVLRAARAGRLDRAAILASAARIGALAR
jgi:beta-N-acetylhexosaminidase